MEIQRINSYVDKRFSEKVLLQHGCFLADDIPYEVEIISDHEASVLYTQSLKIFPTIDILVPYSI